MPNMRAYFSYSILFICRIFSKIFYTHKISWVDKKPDNAWQDIRVIALLNHTSLYEWLYLPAASPSLLFQIAEKAVIPIADITMKRPIIGKFFKILSNNVISVTRKKDDTWKQVLDRLHDGNLIVILPEGRMMRANGLDKNGKPMSVRGGISDVIGSLDSGNMLLAYSGGLHHVQIPGQHFPKLFKTLGLRLEQVNIANYKQQLKQDYPTLKFKQAVMKDLDKRRDTQVAVLKSNK
jgi:hypothetical protein